MKFFPSLLCSSKWTLCLCLLLPTVSGLYSQTNDLAKLNERRAEIQGLLNDGIILEAIRKLEDYLQQRPDDLAARKQICQAYLDLKDYFKLRYHTRIILQEFPEDSEALAWSATADKIIAEKYAVMVEDLLDALKDDPENTVLRRELISLYMTGDEGEKAAEQFHILLERQPDDEALWLDFARNLFWSDQPEESLVAYQQYLAVAEEPKDVRLEIARVHAANADFGTAVDQLRALIKDVPGNFDASSLLGDIYRWNDDAMAAEEIYRAVLLEEPDHGPSLRGLEELANMAQRKVITTASMNIESMREKVEDEPENMDILLQLARLYTTKNRYAEGAEAFDQYLENQPDDLPVRREYAFTLSILERYDEAIRQLRLYLQEFPDDMTERMRIARMLLWQGKNEAAKRELLEMEAIIPDNPELHWNLARIYEIEADWPQAIARYEALREVSPRFEVASAKIRAIESNPYYRIATMERRIEADASDTAARLQLARIFLNLDRFYEAQEQAQAVLDYEPDQEQASRILGQAEIGVSQARRNRIEELKGILAEDTENFEAMLELARYYRDEVDYPEALRYYYSYLKAFPQDRQARLEYARVLSWQPEQRESAISEYAILIEDQPENIDLRLTHLELLSAANALTAQETVLMAEIEDALRQQLSTNSEDAEALLFMGRLYQINSKWPEALDFYSAAIAASDRDQQGTPIADRIESILALPDYQLAQLFTQVEVDPSDVLTRLILARQLFDLKRYYEAREQASRLLDYDPGNVEASRIIGWAEIGIEEVLTERIRTARSDIRENPQDMEATLELARSLKEAENYPESLIYYYQYLKANPDDVGVREEYAQVLSWDPPQLSVAVQEYGVLSDVRPDDIALQVQYYDLVNRLGELSDRDLTVLSAIEDSLRERILLDDQDSEALFYLGRLHQIDENWKSAIEYYEAAIAAGDADSTIRNQIDTILALPDFRMARLFAEVEANPSDVPTRLSLARQLFDLERYYEAREQAIQLLAYDPGNIEATRIVGWSDIGIEEIVTERIRTARAKILKNPQDMEVALELARLLREAEVYPEALRYFYHYLQAYPDDLEVREEYAQVLSWEPSQLPGAVRELGILAEMRPDDMALQLQYYELLNRVGELSDYDLTVLSAIEDRLRERVFFNDQDSEALFYLGRLHQINANWNSAIEYYQAAIAAGIEDTSAQDRIESMLAMPDFQLAQFAALVEANPSDVRTRLSLANQLFDLERYYEAREQATQALAYDPDNVEASRIVGWSDIGIEKVVAERIRTARGNITRNPQDMGAALELARLLKDAENYPESLRYYYHYLQAYPDDLVVREEYAQVLSWEPSQLPGAVRELGILAEMRPDDMELQLQYYELLNRERDLSDYDLTVLSSIEDRLRERVFFNDQDSEALFYLGRLHQINTNWNSAIEYYQAAIAAGIQDTSVQNRIESMLAMPDFQLAQLFAQVEANPSAVPSRLSLARQLFDLERYYEAREQANQLLAYDPDNVEASRIVGWSDIGIEEVVAERIRTARSNIARNPQDMDAALELARLLKDGGSYPESMRYYYHYLEAFPNDIEVREEYAQVLSWEPSQLPSAVRELGVLAEMRPDDMALQLQYYELLNQEGDLSGSDLTMLSAIEDRLRERIFFNDQDSEALFYLGRLHQINTNWNSAIEYYQAAIAAGIQDTSVQDRIESMLAMPDFQLAQFFAQVEANPADVLRRLSLARQLFDLERYYEAREQANQVLAFDPGNVEASRIIARADTGIAVVQNQRMLTARSRIAQNPQDVDAALELARLLRDAENYPESLRYYYDYLAAYPDDIEVREEYAQVLSWEPSQLPSAVRELAILAEMRPEDLTLQLQYYELLDQQGELNRGDLSILSAIEDRLRERVYFNNQDSEALFYLGRLHQIEENWNSALDYYEAAIAAGNEDTSIRNRIASISTTPDFQIASLEAKVANNPNDIDLRLSLVQLLLQSERYYAAQEQAQEVLQLSGSNREAREMYNYASQWIEGKQVADLQNLRFQVTENPRDLDAQLALARMIRNEGAYGEAAQRYRLYLQAYPEDLEVRREYADTLAWSGKNSDAAISEYKDLLFAYPNDRELKMQYARMLSWNPKYWNEADEVLEELAMLDGNNPEILIMQADILRFRGRYGAAQLLYDQVLEMGGTGFYGSGQRFGDERFVAGDQRNTGEANVAANRPSLFQPYVFNNQRLESEDFRPNNVIYEDFDRRSNQTPARTIYRPISDEEAVRRYRDTLLNTTPDSPRNSIRYPQGSLPPQAKPDVLPSVSEQDSASAHASSGSDNSLESVPFPEVMPEATAVDTPYGVSAHFTGEKTKWRRPKPEDYKIVLAAMVMNSTDDSSRGASIAAKPPTNALLEKGGYEPSRRGDSIKMARPSERPRHAERDLGTAASMTRESMAPPERYVPGARVGKRDFLDEESQSVDSRSVDENALRTYAIPGDGSVRVEQSLPVDTRPETVERVIYREPVYQVRPELGSQRVVEYVTEPNRRLELPRRNLDQRLMFDETPIATRAPLRRTESQRVELPFEPLPEPPRFYPERDRGVDTRTGTSLPPPTMYNRRAVNDRMSTPVRNSNSRALRELERFGDTREPVRNTRERVAPRESRDSDYDSRSILPPPTPFIPTAKGNREGQSSLILRETERPRSNNTFEADMNRRSRLIEDNGMREREMRAPLREMRAPLREMRAPVRERDFREPIPSLRKEGSNYYNSIENKLLESESLLGRDSLEPLWQAQL